MPTLPCERTRAHIRARRIHGERGECSQEFKRQGRRCGRETTTRVATERARPSREKRIETLGFSLETDDACGSLRERDYERQLEIRSKQMDCENTSSLSLSLFLCVRALLSSHFSHLHPRSMPNIRPEGVTSELDRRCADFSVSIRDIPLSNRKAQSEYR